jgi:hypothetical protein
MNLNVLLFVEKYCDSVIHQKQYQPVYKMKNGKWYHNFLKNMIQQNKKWKETSQVKMAEPITVPSYQSYRKLETFIKAVF